jgi:hypothetical protein
MTRTIPLTHRNTIITSRENMIRQQESAQRQVEVLRAKWIQGQTGCTWTEALKEAYTEHKQRKTP